MFTGKRLFDCEDEVDVLAHQLLVSPPRPSERLPAIDPRAERVILAATRKDPEQRYPDMRAMFADLSRLGVDDAELWAPERSGDDPDVYVPSSTVARHVGVALARAIGATPPVWTETVPPGSTAPPRNQ
jgi:serine/threonine-protein kinase